MKTIPHHARLLAFISGALLFTSMASAEQPIDEIIVRGTPTELELDDNAWRIDVKRHVSRVARNVRSSLASGSSEPLVATTSDLERG